MQHILRRKGSDAFSRLPGTPQLRNDPIVRDVTAAAETLSPESARNKITSFLQDKHKTTHGQREALRKARLTYLEDEVCTLHRELKMTYDRIEQLEKVSKRPAVANQKVEDVAQPKTPELVAEDPGVSVEALQKTVRARDTQIERLTGLIYQYRSVLSSVHESEQILARIRASYSKLEGERDRARVEAADLTQRYRAAEMAREALEERLSRHEAPTSTPDHRDLVRRMARQIELAESTAVSLRAQIAAEQASAGAKEELYIQELQNLKDLVETSMMDVAAKEIPARQRKAAVPERSRGRVKRLGLFRFGRKRH